MDEGSKLVLEELREHRREFQSFRDDAYGRLHSLEITRAEDKGSKKTLLFLSGGSLLGVLSFFETIWTKISGH